MKRVLVVLTLAFAAVGLLAVPASAGGTPSGSITLDTPDLHHGDTATFTVTFSGKSGMQDRLYRNLVCEQAGVPVLASRWFLGGSPSSPVTFSYYLGHFDGEYFASTWTSGEADCVGSIERQKQGTVTVLDTVAFHVAA